jgi:hypothetical protein
MLGKIVCIHDGNVTELFRMLCNKAFRAVCVGILKAEMLQWAGSVDRMGTTRFVYNVCCGNSGVARSFSFRGRLLRMASHKSINER